MGVFAGETFSYTDQQEMQAQATSCWGRGNILVNGHRRKKNMVDLLIMVVLKSHIGSRQPVGKPS